MPEITITKRDGRVEKLDPSKINTAAKKALEEVGSSYNAEQITEAVLAKLSDGASVEYIQDCVEGALLEAGEVAAAHAFIRYREQRTNARELKSDLFKQFDLVAGKASADVEFKRENANINADSPMGAMLKYGSESSKEYTLKRIIKPEYAKLHRQGDIHVHDLDFFSITYNCGHKNSLLRVITPDGQYKVIKAGEFCPLGPGSHELEGWWVMARDGEYVPLTHVHIRPSDTINRITSQYSELRLTDNHIVPVTRNGERIEVKVKDMRPGDELELAEFSQVPGKMEISILDIAPDEDLKNIVIRDNTKLLKILHDRGLITQYYSCLKNRGVKFNHYTAKMNLLEYRKYRGVFLDAGFNEDEAEICWSKGRSKSPLNYKLTGEFGWLVGMMYAEGCTHGNASCSISNKDQTYLARIEELVHKYFGDLIITRSNIKRGVVSLTINSKFVRQFFQHIFTQKNYSYDMSIPTEFFSYNTEFLNGVVAGFLDGDGCVSDATVFFGSASEQFIDDLRYILSMSNVNARKYHRVATGKTKFCCGVPFVDDRDSWSLTAFNRDMDGILKESMKWTAVDHRYPQLIRPLVNSVKSVGVEEYNDFVYDFTTDTHYFALNNVIVHNCVVPETVVILKRGGSEQRISIKDAFPLLGNGTHSIDGVEIMSRNGFTPLHYVHIRDADEMMYEFVTSNRTLECTGEHVLPVIRDGKEVELAAKDISQSDKLLVHHSRYSWEDVNKVDDGTIKSIRKYHFKGKVVDLTTGDHYFIANNIVSHNCCQIPLGKLLREGFNTGHGYIRQPNSILSAATVACIVLQANQNDMFGGQSFPMWDYDLAPYVARSFIKHAQNVSDILGIELAEDFREKCLDYYNKNSTLISAKEFLATLGVTEEIHSQAYRLTDRETHQAMQAVIHNLNTMQCLTADMPVATLDLSSAVNLRRISDLELDALRRLLQTQYQTMTIDEMAMEHKTTKGVMRKILVNLGVKLRDKLEVAQVNKRIFMERFGVDNSAKDPAVKEKIKQTQFAKYGKFAFNTEKQRQTNLARYGADNPMKNPGVIKKMTDGNIKKWGYPCTLQHPDVKAKSVATCLAKYGVSNAGWSPEAIAKRQQTCIDRFGVPTPFDSKEIREQGEASCLERYGHKHPGLALCLGRSKAEDMVANMIEEMFPDLAVLKNIRGLLPSHRLHEIGILLPELSIGFEVNGEYSHDKDAYERGEMTKERIKEQAAESVGIKIYQVWECDLYKDQDATAELIRNVIEEAMDD